MPRKRTKQPAIVTERILALMRAGATAETIASTLKAEGAKGVSRATIGRRIRELRGEVNAERAEQLRKRPRNEDPPMPTSPESIPEGVDPSTFDRWLDKAETMARTAEQNGDLDGFGKMGRLTTALLEAKRKATPIARPDPNENPDMRAAKERARAEFHKLIDKVLVS